MFQQEVMDKVTGQCPQTTTFLKRKESQSGIEPRSFRLPAYRLTARPNRLSDGQTETLLFIRFVVRELSTKLSPQILSHSARFDRVSNMMVGCVA